MKEAILAAALATVSMCATAVTLTFDEVAPPGGNTPINIGSLYQAQGFDIRYIPGNWGDGMIVYGPETPYWTGSPGVVAHGVGAGLSLTRSDGGLFDAYSLDLSRGDSNGGAVPVAFVGKKADGSFVNATFFFDEMRFSPLRSFALGSEFTGLSELSWRQGAVWHQFDNITVSAPSGATPMPEPTTALLLLAGLAGIGVARRHKGR